MIVYAGLTSALGLYFLSQCAEKVGGRNTSFASLSKLTWPRLGVFFDIAIAVKCFGVAVSYLIIIGDLMPQVKEIREGKKWILTPPFIGTFIFF